MAISRRSFGAAAVFGTLRSSGKLLGLTPRPKLTFVILAEQFRSDYLDWSAPLLAPGGFRRLMSQGAFFPDCRMVASSFTASGLATLCTGAWPQVHGIVAESWFDRASRRVVRAAPEALDASTVADQFTGNRRNRVIAVGMDPVHVAVVAGRSPLAMFQMDPTGQFTLRGTQFDWFRAYQRARPMENLHNARWLALSAKPGAPPLRILKHDPGNPRDFVALYKASPFSQDAQFELARELVAHERLGQADGFDSLFLVLGAMAQLGYEVGADSPLMQQMVLHLDRQIEVTLEVLDKAPGAGNYNLIFAAAHGAPPAGHKAIPGETVARGLNRLLSDQFDGPAVKNQYVERYVYPFLYLRHEQLRRYSIDSRQARAAAGRAALNIPGVTGYYTADGDCSHAGDWLMRFRNSFHATRSGDLMLSYGPELVEDFGAGRGISYGSLYNYDIRVPLLLFGAQYRPAIFEGQVEAVDVAPTLARAAGVAYPSSSTGRVLGEAFR